MQDSASLELLMERIRVLGESATVLRKLLWMGVEWRKGPPLWLTGRRESAADPAL